MTPIAVIDMDIRSAESTDRAHRLDCYDLADVDLSQYAGLLVPPSVDQEHLLRHRDLIRSYLDAGGVVVFGGHLHRRWLPSASTFVPLSPPSLGAYRVADVADHPVFAGVEPDDLTFRRGVAGFFARGHHPPPDGAEILVRLARGEPVTYVDRSSTAGTILVQATCDLLGYGGGAGNAGGSASTIGDQLLAWVRSESRIRTDAAIGGHAPPSSRLTRLADRGLAAIYSGSAAHDRALTTPKYACHLTGGCVYLPELPDVDLTGLNGLVIPERMHRGLLDAGAGRVLDLLDAGGTVITFSGGEPLPEFLPGIHWEHRPTNFWWWLEPGADLGLRAPAAGHPLFDHLDLPDCAWHHHGVLRPPDGADVLVELPTGEALLYVDQVSTPGTLVVSTLDPLSHFGGYFMPATERFLNGFLPWAEASSRRSAT
ncbi:MAG: hypothetical protein WD232_02480 [Acidimicrobiales bacterium]